MCVFGGGNPAPPPPAPLPPAPTPPPAPPAPLPTPEPVEQDVNPQVQQAKSDRAVGENAQGSSQLMIPLQPNVQQLGSQGQGGGLNN